MTPIILLDELAKFIKEATKDLLLPVQTNRNGTEIKERPPGVYKMRLPTVEAETKRIPYVLLQFIKQTDTQKAGKRPESTCMVRIIAATYSENGEEGALALLNLLSRIRIALMKDNIIGGKFLMKPGLEMIIYPDSTKPYYLGEMMTEWSMPIIESEVQSIWQ